jgi:hypothetical protein
MINTSGEKPIKSIQVKCKRCNGVGHYMSRYGMKACDDCNTSGKIWKTITKRTAKVKSEKIESSKNESGEKQRLTLQQCKDHVAKSRSYESWRQMEIMEHQINSGSWQFLLKATEEAAELYASQSLPIREKPDFEKIAQDFYSDFIGDPTLNLKALLEKFWKDYVEPIPGK